MEILQKPQIIFTKVRDFLPDEVWEHFCHQLWVFDGDRKVLLSNGFPVHAAELVNLIDEVVDDFVVIGSLGFGAADADLHRKRVTVGGVEVAIVAVTGVVEKQVLVLSEVDKGSAERHEVGPVVIEDNDVMRFCFVDGEDENGDVKPQVVKPLFDGSEFFAAHVFIEVNDEAVDVGVGGYIFLYLEDDGTGQLIGLVFQKTFKLVKFTIVGKAKGTTKVLDF